MPYDLKSQLWAKPDEHFFRDLKLTPQQQSGPHCVSTSLSILTGSSAEDFHGRINTQDPRSWSEQLKPWGMQLAYCPTDVRKLKFYREELLGIDDLFTLSYYTSLDRHEILGDPDPWGWVCGSHIVVMHRDKIIDLMSGRVLQAHEHPCMQMHTKRVFRVVPAGYLAGL